MQLRNMSRTNNSFSNWLSQKPDASPEDPRQIDDSAEGESSSILGQFSSLQESLTSQMQELAGSLPDAGPLSAAFRKRLKLAIYLLIAAAIFFLLAIFVGLPTLILRPSKFVLCITLATILAASSVIVIQKPSVFFKNLLNSGFVNAAPMISVIFASMMTIYLTVFIKRYIVIILAAAFQVCCVLWYLASFIPGGTRGLQILGKAAFLIIKTLLKPCIFVTKKTISSIMSHIFS